MRHLTLAQCRCAVDGSGANLITSWLTYPPPKGNKCLLVGTTIVEHPVRQSIPLNDSESLVVPPRL